MNRLGKEISPYLLQHAHNPVDWFPWGEEALAQARAENKPIFLSIGYATCHWCHVMEGDSFEQEDVATLLNQHFIAIKVDREERPDIDSLYMKAVQAMDQRGGWPLSVMLTPQGQPFWGGTFFPRAQFKQVLQRLATLWQTKQADIEDGAFELIEHLRMAESRLSTEEDFHSHTLQAFMQKELASYDHEWGGFGSAPKFPPAMAILGLLRCYRRFHDEKALSAVVGTLDSMARGGMRDHVGGGFHRYSVDQTWLVPHFEKMLYDNGLLTLAYSEAYQITRSNEYHDVVATTLNYVLRDMQSPEGGYYSAEDADSEKTEGKFYVWTDSELRASLSDHEYSALTHYFAIQPGGNFKIDRQVEELEAAAGLKALQHANILHQQKRLQLATMEDSQYKNLLDKLLNLRAKRIRPLLDDKILTAWNGLMIGAMAKAYRVFGEESWRKSAERAADFILTHLKQGPRLYRSHRQGETRYNAYLEDYAGLIFGLLELYQATFAARWLRAAVELQTTQDQIFWDAAEAGYFDTDGEDGTVLLRSKDFMDNATPAGNNLSAWNLIRLSALCSHSGWQTQAQQILRKTSSLMQRFPGSFPMLMLPLDWTTTSHKELVVATKTPDDLRWPALCPGFAPTAIFMLADPELEDLCPNLVGKSSPDGATRYYLCEQGSCQPASTDLVAIQRSLTAF